MGDRINLASDHLESMQYDEDTQVLDITFTDGSSYSYDDVPEKIAQGLRMAASASHYFRNYIKNKYRYYRA